MSKVHRRVVFAFDFTHEDGEIGALVAAKMLKEHASFIEQMDGQVDQLGSQYVDRGRVEWHAAPAEILDDGA